MLLEFIEQSFAFSLDLNRSLRGLLSRVNSFHHLNKCMLGVFFYIHRSSQLFKDFCILEDYIQTVASVVFTQVNRATQF